MIGAEICVYGVDYAQIADKLLPDADKLNGDPVAFLSQRAELITERVRYWCTYHNVSMEIYSIDIDYAVLDGDRVDNSVSVVIRADRIIASELTAALGISGTLLKISELVPNDFSVGVISRLINMNSRIISAEGVRLLRKKGIRAESISMRMIRNAEAVLK